jgi:hypothetical protein
VRVVVSRSRDAVLAYSKVARQWCKQPIRVAPGIPILPVTSDKVAAVQIGNEVFAFSAALGRWKSISLPSNLKAIPIVDAWCVTIQAGSMYYVFSPETCAWSSVNLQNGTIEPK